MSMLSTNEQETARHWYALWVYRSKVSPIIDLCEGGQAEYYQPMRLSEHYTENGLEYREEAILSNLLFVKTTERHLKEIQLQSNNRGHAYCYPGTNLPAIIADRDMEIFKLVVKKGAQKLEQVDFPIDKGDKVRVIDGIFKGAEGYIRRIHGSRRFVVAIEGVVAVAVTHIPRQFLERVED